MRIRTDTLADGGCWISDDRVYAFVSAHGIAELGYHGLQPVSRNSRIFVHHRAAFECSVIPADGRRRVIPFDELQWQPGAAGVEARLEHRTLGLEVRLSGRRLTITISARQGGTPPVVIRCPRESLFADVQGERHWEIGPVVDGSLRLSCRDRIVFDTWIRRSGAYRGDFLIPESWRRVLFQRRLRSGEATLEDVRPEYRDAPIPLYDATTWVFLGGKAFVPDLDGEDFVFTSEARSSRDGAVVFEVRFEDDPPHTPSSARRDLGTSRIGDGAEHPRLEFPRYPHLATFFNDLPDVVNSCVVSEFGVPRATPGRYYWIWAWDLMVTAVEMLRWGDLEGARSAARFVSTHRDLDGRIPGRWTRALEALDAPEEGAGLEFLLAHLTYEVYLEGGNLQDILDIYPTLVGRFRQLRRTSTPDGLMRGKGFYPDLPGRFGRSEHTATAIESGCWYGLCRILQNLALLIGDATVAEEAAEVSRRLQASFTQTFWDPVAGTIQDAVDQQTGRGTGRHPVFSYLCLQTPLALPLVRARSPEIARSMRGAMLTDHGLRTVPIEERGDGTEVILDAWYPHWDLYILRFFRRNGDREALQRWLSLAETALEHLGYCPEFLELGGFRSGDPSAWTRHGAPSNLNCATAWYRALLEVLFGLELDPGGLTVTATAPGSIPVSVRGVQLRRAQWDIDVVSGGPSLVRCLVDGTDLGGCRKIPRPLCGPGRHHLAIHYGPACTGITLEELVNAEVLEIRRADPDHLRLRIQLLGPGEFLFRSDRQVRLRLDGESLPGRWDPDTGRGWGALEVSGEHEFEITLADQPA